MIVVISNYGKRFDKELKKLGFEFIRSLNHYELKTDRAGFELIKPTINYLLLNYSVKEENEDMFLAPWFRIYVYCAEPLVSYLVYYMPHVEIKKSCIIIQTYSISDMQDKTKKILEIIKSLGMYKIMKINHKQDATFIYVDIF